MKDKSLCNSTIYSTSSSTCRANQFDQSNEVNSKENWFKSETCGKKARNFGEFVGEDLKNCMDQNTSESHHKGKGYTNFLQKF